MTLEDARKIFGLGPDDDAAAHLAEFREARERIAEFVRLAPNDTLALRFQEDLEEFDRALAAVREHMELPEIPVTPEPPLFPGPSPLPAAVKEESARPEPLSAAEPAPVVAKRGGGAKALNWSLVLLLAAMGGGYVYLRIEEDKQLQLKGRVTFLERQGAIFVENRRWQEAREAYEQIEVLAPDSEIVSMGRRSIEAGIDEEQRQFLGYWMGEGLAALESNRLDDAQKAVELMLSMRPGDPGAIELRGRIERARSFEKIQNELLAAKLKLDARDWEGAITASAAILHTVPGQPEATTILADATTGQRKQELDFKRAADLLKQAKALDQGSFNPKALELLREAAVLAPADKEVAALLEKMSSYSRTVRVPGDFATPADALANAHDRDRILIDAGQWKGPLLIDKEVELQGAGSGKTEVECPADSSAVISFGPGARGVRVTGITFRHQLLDPAAERFSVGLVKGGDVSFTDCHFLDGAGHGLAVIGGGTASALRCRFAGNGWDGASASGPGSTLLARESEATGNFEHGLDLWDGAGGALTGNRCEGNSRNGIQIDAKAAAVTVSDNQLKANREFGLVLASAASGDVRGNSITGNLLGGLVVRTLAQKLVVTNNRIQSGKTPSIVLEKGLSTSTYKPNEITGAVMDNVSFDPAPPEKP